jgi:TetR/AcrR family transcriptional regulator, transcriptional repressor for nem operon
MGRTREFDPKDAAEKAMHLFWTKGYYDTSIRDLVDHTGVNPYGLYSVFTDKRGLFLAAIAHYQETVTRDILSALDGTAPARDGIRAVFDRAQKVLMPHQGHAGCLMCNTAIELAPHDEEVAQIIGRHLQHLQARFLQELTRAQTANEIAPDKDLKALSEYFATAAYSLGMLLRAGMSQAHVRRHIATTLSLLD